MPAYLIDGHRRSLDEADFGSLLALAHTSRSRPTCLCTESGPEMYVARLGPTFILKRMPGTGGRHAATCSSYEPLRTPSAHPTQETAITRNPETGETLLKMAFALSVGGGTHHSPPNGAAKGQARSRGGLTLLGLLHYLWDKAGLTEWQPGFAGRRHWAMVRRRLTVAAEATIASGRPLQRALYMPEPFYVERRAEIAARRRNRWVSETRAQGLARPLLLLVGEVKHLTLTRLGHVAVIKQVPDEPFALDEAIYGRTAQDFDLELRLWKTAPSLRLISIASFAPSRTGPPTVEELALMLTNVDWLPVDDEWDLRLLGRLQAGRRTFAKRLSHDRPKSDSPTVVLLDASSSPDPLYIDRGNSKGSHAARAAWTWRTTESCLPRLPAPRPSPAARSATDVARPRHERSSFAPCSNFVESADDVTRSP